MGTTGLPRHAVPQKDCRAYPIWGGGGVSEVRGYLIGVLILSGSLLFGGSILRNPKPYTLNPKP